MLDGYDVTVELNYDKVRKAIAYRDPGLVKTGTLADGRGTYATSGSLELTNTDIGHTFAYTDTYSRLYTAGYGHAHRYSETHLDSETCSDLIAAGDKYALT